MNFFQQLNELAQAAENFVLGAISSSKKLLLLEPEPDPDIDLESLLELLEGLPTGHWINKHDFVDYFSIVGLALEGDEVKIEGIFTGENFPERIKVSLSSLRREEVILLANHIVQSGI